MLDSIKDYVKLDPHFSGQSSQIWNVITDLLGIANPWRLFLEESLYVKST